MVVAIVNVDEIPTAIEAGFAEIDTVGATVEPVKPLDPHPVNSIGSRILPITLKRAMLIVFRICALIIVSSLPMAPREHIGPLPLVIAKSSMSSITASTIYIGHMCRLIHIVICMVCSLLTITPCMRSRDILNIKTQALWIATQSALRTVHSFRWRTR